MKHTRHDIISDLHEFPDNIIGAHETDRACPCNPFVIRDSPESAVESYTIQHRAEKCGLHFTKAEADKA